MRTGSRFAAAGALLLGFLAPPAAIAEPPRCTAVDMAAEIRQQSAEAWQRIRDAARRTENANAILWRITGPKGPPSHLFGTIHLTDDRVTRLTPATEQALTSANTVALEVADLAPEQLVAALAKVQALLVFGDGRSLSTLLTAEEQASARSALEKAGMPGAALAALKPWVVSMMLALSDCERRRTAYGLKALDVQIGDRARGLGRRVVGLETLEDQLRAMAAVPDGDQLQMLRAGLALYGRTGDAIETMVQRYLDRDLGSIWPLQIEVWRSAGFDAKPFQSFQKHMLGNRNLRMRDAALPLVAEGGAFIAVGALHLPGGDGLVTLFRDAGYKVEPGE